MKRERTEFTAIVCLFSATAMVLPAAGKSMMPAGSASPHHLSSSTAALRASGHQADGTGCSTCHVSGNRVGQKPAWSSDGSESQYSLYGASGSHGKDTTPAAYTMVCLSCHDGTLPSASAFSISGADRGGEWQLGLFRIDAFSSSASGFGDAEHPVSVKYEPKSGNDLRPAIGGKVGPLPLFGPNHDTVECATCHDPHGSPYPASLRMPNNRSALCLTCHRK